MRAQAILQETILAVLQKMFPHFGEEITIQIKNILFIDDLKRLLAFIVYTNSEIVIRQEILAYLQEAANYHVVSGKEAR